MGYWLLLAAYITLQEGMKMPWVDLSNCDSASYQYWHVHLGLYHYLIRSTCSPSWVDSVAFGRNDSSILQSHSRMCSSTPGSRSSRQSEKRSRLESLGWSCQLRRPTNKSVALPPWVGGSFIPIIIQLFSPTVTSLLRKLKQQSRESLEQRRPALIAALKDLGDFYLEVKWDFHSWGECLLRPLPLVLFITLCGFYPTRAIPLLPSLTSY